MDSDGYFGEHVAKTYDRDHGGTDGALIQQTADLLADLAGEEAVLEFAIGTGRLALPLSERGYRVKGIELSRAMVAQLREKETGPPIEVVIGDMTTAHVEGVFSLVFLAFNTIDNLVTQEAQIACFKNAANHLLEGGRFLIETQVPQVQKIPFGQTMAAFACDPNHMGVDVVDIATQRYTSNHIWIEDGTPRQLTIPFRYAWPSELDLMAKLAGFELEHRWGNWERGPFTRFSKSHISVWRLPRQK